MIHCHDKEYEPQTVQRGDFWVLKNYVRADHGELRCFESVTYTTHADYTFLDNLIPLLERYVKYDTIQVCSECVCAMTAHVRYDNGIWGRDRGWFVTNVCGSGFRDCSLCSVILINFDADAIAKYISSSF